MPSLYWKVKITPFLPLLLLSAFEENSLLLCCYWQTNALTAILSDVSSLVPTALWDPCARHLCPNLLGEIQSKSPAQCWIQHKAESVMFPIVWNLEVRKLIQETKTPFLYPLQPKGICTTNTSKNPLINRQHYTVSTAKLMPMLHHSTVRIITFSGERIKVKDAFVSLTVKTLP